MTTITLEGMRFHSFIGYHPEESVLVNEIEVSLRLSLDSQSIRESDDIKNTIDYEEVYTLVKRIVSERVNLLETVAYKIINEIIVKYPQLNSLQIKVSKLHPPLSGIIDRVSIEEEWVRNTE